MPRGGLRVREREGMLFAASEIHGRSMITVQDLSNIEEIFCIV